MLSMLSALHAIGLEQQGELQRPRQHPLQQQPLICYHPVLQAKRVVATDQLNSTQVRRRRQKNKHQMSQQDQQQHQHQQQQELLRQQYKIIEDLLALTSGDQNIYLNSNINQAPYAATSASLTSPPAPIAATNARSNIFYDIQTPEQRHDTITGNQQRHLLKRTSDLVSDAHEQSPNQALTFKRTCRDLNDELQGNLFHIEGKDCIKLADYDNKSGNLLALWKKQAHEGHPVESRHLVRTVSDLPIFVTIEGYRVASYADGGEFYLCLPQLLQNIKQEFPLDKIIDTFEETVTNFTTATPKQVEGFTKASALPPDAKTCPLIRRTDADRVCLRLFDQNHKKICNNIVDFCSNSIPTTSDCDNEKRNNDERSSSEVTTILQKIVCAGSTTDDTATSGVSIGKDFSSDGKNDEQSGRKIADNKSAEKTSFAAGLNRRHSAAVHPDRNHLDGSQTPVAPKSSSETSINELGMIKRESRFITTDDSESPSDARNQNTEKIVEEHKTVGQDLKSEIAGVGMKDPLNVFRKNIQPTKERLFESEVQGSILNLARAVTSTLMIQVYHRCFGKCVGLYYPALVANSESNCIECSSCHLLLSPRRFVGHTHGVKETSICHWGFNSYHWRHYIRLSRKQAMNSLDDDELLIQFEKLRSMDDPPDAHVADEQSKSNSIDSYRDDSCNVDLSKLSDATTTVCRSSTSTLAAYQTMDTNKDLSLPSTSARLPNSSGLPPIQESAVELRRDLYVSTSIASYLRSRNVNQDLIRDVVDNTLIFLHKSRTIL